VADEPFASARSAIFSLLLERRAAHGGSSLNNEALVFAAWKINRMAKESADF